MRRSIAVLAALISTAAIPASANAAIAPGDYVIRTGASAFTKVLDVQGGFAGSGGRVIQFTRQGGLNQQWNVIQSATTGNGTPAYSLRPRHNLNLCMDIPGGSITSGANVITFTCHFGKNQQFFINRNGGEFEIIARHSGQKLTMPSFLNSTLLIQRPPSAGSLPPSQQFLFSRP